MGHFLDSEWMSYIFYQRLIKHTFAILSINPGESQILRLPSKSKTVWSDYSGGAKSAIPQG